VLQHQNQNVFIFTKIQLICSFVCQILIRVTGFSRVWIVHCSVI